MSQLKFALRTLFKTPFVAVVAILKLERRVRGATARPVAAALRS